jgi:hypothetical protein
MLDDLIASLQIGPVAFQRQSGARVASTPCLNAPTRLRIGLFAYVTRPALPNNVRRRWVRNMISGATNPEAMKILDGPKCGWLCGGARALETELVG